MLKGIYCTLILGSILFINPTLVNEKPFSLGYQMPCPLIYPAPPGCGG